MHSNEIFNIVQILIPFTMTIGAGFFAKKKYNKMPIQLTHKLSTRIRYVRSLRKKCLGDKLLVSMLGDVM